MSAVTSALQQIFLLKDLGADALAVVEQACSAHTFDAGQDICREGQASDGLFLLRSGSARVSKSGADTDVVMLGSGSHFGELGLIDDSPRSATVTANERCDVLKVDAAQLRKKLAEQPAIAASFHQAVARSIAKRLRVTTDDLAFARQLAQDRRRG